MPMHDFECQICKAQTEHFFHASQADVSEIPCEAEGCNGIAVRFYAYKRPHSYQGGVLGVVYKKPDGTYFVPGVIDARVPAGYERVELRSSMDYARVERGLQAEEYAKWEAKTEFEQSCMSQRIARDRSELRRQMQHMQAKSRDFAQYAMDENNKRERPKFKTNVFFEAMHMNASNREAHRDGAGGKREK